MGKSLNQLVKEIGKHSLVYSIAWFANSFVSIALLPVYTRFLSRSDYGVLEMIDLTNGMLLIFIISGFVPAMARFYHISESDADQKQVISTAIWFVLFSSLFWVLAGRFFDRQLAVLLFGNEEASHLIDLGLFWLLLESLFNISSNYFNIVRSSKTFVGYSVIKLIINVALNLWFIVHLGMGAAGMLMGNIAALLLVCPLVILHCFRHNGLRFNVNLLGEMLRFGLPFIPALACASLMHSADRYLLRTMESLAVVGLYGIGYKFPFMLNSLLNTSFSRVWNSSIMYEVSHRPAATYEYARIATYYTTLFCLAQYALAVFSPLVLRLLAAPEYFEAHRVVQVVCLGMCFYCLHPFFVIGAYIKKRTKLLPYAYLVAALVNIGFNLILIPQMGYLGAAWASVATYLAFSGVGFLVFRRIYPIPFEFGRLFFLFAVGIILGGINSLLSFDHFFIELLKEGIFALTFPLLLLIFPYLTSGERDRLYRTLHEFSPFIARKYAAIKGINIS
jgi:O-antigen/teichoic acid export membrane protein